MLELADKGIKIHKYIKGFSGKGDKTCEQVGKFNIEMKTFKNNFENYICIYL